MAIKSWRRYYKKSLRNSLQIIISIAVGLLIIGYSVGSQWLHRKKQLQDVVKCDTASESVDPNTEINAYTSDLFKGKIRTLITTGNTQKRLDTTQHVGALLPIATDTNPAVKNSQATSGSETIYTSQKTGGSEPLGWEADLMASNSGIIDDYGIHFWYNATVAFEVGATYRKNGVVTNSQAFAEVQPSDVWTETTIHFSTYPPDTHPYMTISTAAPGTVMVKNVQVSLLPAKQLPTGIVSIAFDDGWESVYRRGLPLFEYFGVATSQYIVSDFSLGSVPVPEYMNKSQLLTMQKEGHEIGSHSYGHCNALGQSTEALQASIQNANTQFKKAFGAVPTIYAHPFGAYDQRVNDVLGTSYQILRSSDVGYNAAYYDPQNLRIQPVLDSTSVDEVQNWANTAAQQHSWVILLYHRIDEAGDYSITSAGLEQQLRALTATRGIRIMPVGAALKQIDSVK